MRNVFEGELIPGPNGNAKEVSMATRIDPGSGSFTQQGFAEEVDVNTIMRRFGAMPLSQLPRTVKEGVYGDFTGITSYADALAQVSKANDGFMKLPPEVRERFGNDPHAMVEFVQSHTPEEFGALFPAPKEPGVSPAVPPAGVSPAVPPA